jgi:arginyl-tRNA synthetase
MGALKYFILKVDPKKNMTFDPRESIDFNGNTGPFIQYSYARIQSVLRKAGEKGIKLPDTLSGNAELSEKETQLFRMVMNFPNIVKEAGAVYSPAVLANFAYDLAREFNQFYHEMPIVFEEDETKREIRLVLSSMVGVVIKNAMWLLGIDVPERM